jgi:glycosidase
MNKRIARFTVIFVLLLSACSAGTPPQTFTPSPTYTPSPTAIPTSVPVQPLVGLPQGTDGFPWWNDTTFYEIFVRSFYDSNDDGIGDFNGITQKLDYLQELGVTGLWLMPINPSPSYHGYDVTDYYGVNPDYGSMDDFKNLLAEAHKKGIRIIIDLVLNHTSAQHPWFKQAEDPASPYHDWYIWSDKDPGYPGPWGEKVWFPLGGKYYYAMFWDQMPDLNYRNPAVVTEMEKVTKFWLDLGVDGFRLDAVKHLVEEGSNQADTASTHELLQKYYSFYKGVNPNAMTVGELSGSVPPTMAAYIKNKQMDLAFDFGMATSFITSANRGSSTSALGKITLSNSYLPPLQSAPFLTNHDQDRLMTQLRGDPERVKAAASMLLTAPGVPFIYYGEEVGLKGSGPDEYKRLPMQWTGGKYAGFSTNRPWKLPGTDFGIYNVADELNDPNSILSHYIGLIQIRNQHAALRAGEAVVIKSNDPGIYGLLRVSHKPSDTASIDEAVLVLVNLIKFPIKNYTLSVENSSLPAGNYRVAPIMGTGLYNNLTVSSGGSIANYIPINEIPANTTLILQLQP